jgi:adenylate cyclase
MEVEKFNQHSPERAKLGQSRNGPPQTDSLGQMLHWLYNRLFPTLLVAIVLVLVWLGGQHAEPLAHDLFMRLSARPATHSPVTLVLIDDDSINRLSGKFGPLPWPRRAYLDVFKAVQSSKPAVMVFDSHFVGLQGHERDDARFFTELQAFPNLISGLVLEESPNAETPLNTRLPEYYWLKLGVVSVNEDEDGIIRSLKPSFRMGMGDVFPSLSLAAADSYLKSGQPLPLSETGHASTSPGVKHAGRKMDANGSHPGHAFRIPLDSQGTFGLRWETILNPNRPEAARSHPAIPLWRFFEPKAGKLDLSGRIALIGASSSFHRDYHKSPMANRHLGPDIHATAIDNFLSERTVIRVSPGLNLTLLALLCLVIFLLRLRYNSISRNLLYTLGSMVIYSWVAFWCLSERGWWLDVVTPLLFMLASFMAASTCRISQKEKQLAVMEKNLSQLVDPEVFQEIRRLSHVLVPGGRKLEITSMFVDIRNFTALAEYLQPHELTEILNAFYGETVNIIFSYHGTIDKFMGDGILIIFGAPLPQEDHRQLAMRAAIDILEATGQLCAYWREAMNIDTEIGITLNSGPAFVGFFGPTDKLEYTGVGDTVNICVRLQEHTKQFGTRLLISESTLGGLSDERSNAHDLNASDDLNGAVSSDSVIALGEVNVRGREGSIRVFTLKQALHS